MSACAPLGRAKAQANVRVMLVDDSIVARSVIQSILVPHPRFRVVATASTADQAFAALDTTAVDVVLLDLAMPGMDGLTALPEIIRRGRGARVLVVSASAGAGADACVRALTLGAADTLEKPSTGYAGAFADALLDKLGRMGAAGPAEHHAARTGLPPATATYLLASRVDGPIACLAIGASTGGPHALAAFFAALPATLDVPILVTQHLPAAFMPLFAGQLATMTGRTATVAANGDALRPGHVLVAPGNSHLAVVRGAGGVRVRLEDAPATSGCLPSVDPMLESVAIAYGRTGFGVVLSGMGRDGMAGARQLVAAGGEVAAQDQVSSVIWGMPGAVATAGLAATVAPPAALALRIVERSAG